MTTPPAPTRTSSTRACRYDGTEMPTGYQHECPTCGWRMGLLPVAEAHDTNGASSVAFILEQPSRYGRTGILMTLIASFVIILVGAAHNIGITLVGLAALTVVAVAAWDSRFGRVTWGLTPGMQTLTRLLIGIGTVLAWCTIIGVVIGLSGDRIMRNV